MGPPGKAGRALVDGDLHLEPVFSNISWRDRPHHVTNGYRHVADAAAAAGRANGVANCLKPPE